MDFLYCRKCSLNNFIHKDQKNEIAWTDYRLFTVSWYIQNGIIMKKFKWLVNFSYLLKVQGHRTFVYTAESKCEHILQWCWGTFCLLFKVLHPSASPLALEWQHKSACWCRTVLSFAFWHFFILSTFIYSNWCIFETNPYFPFHVLFWHICSVVVHI